MKKKKTNIIFFNPDHYRPDVLGHMGNAGAVTPNLDKMVAEDAVSFSNTFCQAGVCTPSRCSFMSGMYPHTRGYRTMFHMLQENDPMLLRELKDDGYFVWWGGKNDVVPAQNGFDAYCDVKYEPTKKLAGDFHFEDSWRGNPEDDTFHSFFKGKIDVPEGEEYYDKDWSNVLGAVEQLKNLPDDDRPFCFHLPLMSPHPPIAVEEPYFSMIDRDKVLPRIPEPEDWSGKASMLKGICENRRLGTWSDERWTELRAVVYGMCARLDAQLGMIIKTLKDIGEYDNTAIFFYSDHGAYVGDYGVVDLSQNTFEDVLTKVPFIIKPPKGIPVKPGVRDCLTEMIDFKATVEDICGIESTHSQFGKSLLPIISGEKEEHRDAVFCEGGRLHGEKHCAELEYEAGHTNPNDMYYPRLILQASEGPEHTKASMCRTEKYKYIKRLYEQDEFYDLEKDPQELKNEINNADYADEITKLKERTLQWYMETCDIVEFKPDQRV